jgi:membrane protein implicated in regulation of membrane protease activity
MIYAYMVCAVVGGTILLCQFALTLLGLTDDFGAIAGDVPHDVDAGAALAGHHGDGNLSDPAAHHHGSTWLFGVITFRTVVAALTFFGLAGLAAQSNGATPAMEFVIALAAGAAAMYGVHYLMQTLHKLHADGTARIEGAIGEIGTVYLSVPGHNSGQGKVHLNLQDRTVEYEALTADEHLPAGAKVVVVGVAGPETVSVSRAPEPESLSHA